LPTFSPLFLSDYGDPRALHPFPTRRSSDLRAGLLAMANAGPDTNGSQFFITFGPQPSLNGDYTIFGELIDGAEVLPAITRRDPRSEEHTSELQSRENLVCRLLLEKKKTNAA